MDIATKKLGMRKTKMGYGDKETVRTRIKMCRLTKHQTYAPQGYIVGQSNVRKLGLVLIGASILFIIIGFTMQSVSNRILKSHPFLPAIVSFRTLPLRSRTKSHT
jgi:hypothetical protein